MKPALILASSSAARQAMLRQAGVEFTARPARLDEGAVKAGWVASAAALALALASLKATAISRENSQALVIGADQLLVCDGQNFSKPEGLAAAAAQLRSLSGKTHELVTAACVYRSGIRLWRDVARPALTMRALSEDFIADYLAAEGAQICACVGAYRLEGAGVQLFERIEGDFFTILGLQLLPLLGFLRRAGALAG